MSFLQRNKSAILIIFLFGFFILAILFYKQNLFLEKYDASYWKDRYEHSRHFIPLSQRGIGDDGVYRYGGYKLVEGEDPTKVVYDKPALGVFLIGLSIKFFGNPLYSGFLFGVGSIILFYLLAIRLFKDKIVVLLATFIFSLSPIVFSHFFLSLLDIPQMFFILLNVLLFYEVIFNKSKNNYKIVLILFSGLALGLSAQIKIPIFLPIIFLLQSSFIIYQKKFKLDLFYLLGLFISLVVSYSFYFFHGYSPIDFIKIQKYITTFYTGSTLPFHPHAMWQFLLSGNFPDVVTGIPKYIQEWSLILPIFAILGLGFSIYVFFTKNNLFWKGISIFLLLIFLIFTQISTYPRHILIIFPFLILAGFKFSERFLPRKLLIFFSAVLVIFSVFNAYLFMNQKPSEELEKFYYNYGKFYFQDVYKESLGETEKLNLSKEEFYKKLYATYRKGWIHSVYIKEVENNIDRFDNEGVVRAEFTYNTYFLGPYSEIKDLRLKKINNEWKIIWDWDYVFNGYEPELNVSTEREVGTRGKIVSALNGVIAEDTDGYLVEFNPTIMDPKQETSMLKLLSKISLKGKLDIQNAYLENVPLNTYVPLVTTRRDLKNSELQELKNYKGIKITSFSTRHDTSLSGRDNIYNNAFKECCTKIYSSYNYHGEKLEHNLEFIFDSKLSGFDGGKLMIVDKTKNIIKVLIDKKSKNGEDIII